MQFVAATFSQLLFQIPLYIVWLVGAILCLVHWRRHPTVSLLVLIAILLFFLESFGGNLVTIALPLVLRGESITLLGTLLTIRGIVQVFVSVVAWALILAAVFGWRSEQAETTVDQK